MGNSLFGSRKKMLQTPRTVEEVAALVEITVDRRLEDSIKSTTWASSFYDSLQDEEMKLLFVFLVLCCSLQSKDKKTQELAVFELQNRVFSNCRTGIANIRFRDTDNAVKEIFRLYESNKTDKENKAPVGLQTQVEAKSEQASLRQKILSLKQDRTVRSELEPAYQRHVKRVSPVQQCLLSLL